MFCFGSMRGVCPDALANSLTGWQCPRPQAEEGAQITGSQSGILKEAGAAESSALHYTWQLGNKLTLSRDAGFEGETRDAGVEATIARKPLVASSKLLHQEAWRGSKGDANTLPEAWKTSPSGPCIAGEDAASRSSQAGKQIRWRCRALTIQGYIIHQFTFAFPSLLHSLNGSYSSCVFMWLLASQPSWNFRPPTCTIR